MWHVIAGFLGGMGLFFAGLTLTGAGVKKIAGRRFRQLFLKWTRHPLQGVGVGMAAGFAFQSTAGLSLLLASLIGAGVTTVVNALPVLFGANIGVSFLVLVAVINIRDPIMLLLGATGLILAFKRPSRLVDVAGIAFGVALILLGLEIVRDSTAPLAQAPWFQAFVARQGLPLVGYFAIGAVACVILQSSAGIAILAITLAASGVFDANDALILIYGSLLGSSLLSAIYASPLRGAQKQLAMGQMYFNFIGLAVFIPLFILENHYDIPLLQAATAHFITGMPEQVTAIGILFDCTTALLLLCLTAPYARLLEYLHPDTGTGLDSLAFVRELSDVSPETALYLVNKEQERFVCHLPDYTANLRLALHHNACVNIQGLFQDLEALSDKIEELLLDMVAHGQADANANAVALLQGNQAALRSINTTVRHLVDDLSGNDSSADMTRIGGIFLESLEMLLAEMGAVFTQTTTEPWHVFTQLVADKGPVMERFRDRYLHAAGGLNLDEKGRVLRVTGLFERTSWLLLHLGELQQRFLLSMNARTDEQANAVPICA